MAEIDDHIATYLQAIEIEGKSVKTIASYANTLADFRTIGRRLGFPERPEEYRVPHAKRNQRDASPARSPMSSSPLIEDLAFSQSRSNDDRAVRRIGFNLCRIGYENVFASQHVREFAPEVHRHASPARASLEDDKEVIVTVRPGIAASARAKEHDLLGLKPVDNPAGHLLENAVGRGLHVG